MSVLLLGALAVWLAAFLGGVVGFAYGLVSLPLLLLLGLPLEQVVVVNLVVALITRVVVVWARRHDLDRARAALMLAGVLPGTFAGLLVAQRLPRSTMQLAAGILVLLAVALLIQRKLRGTVPSHPVRGNRARVLDGVAGLLGGFLGATTSLNGVPAALLFTGRRVEARSMVADMAAYFVGGNLITAVVLAVGGRFPLASVAPLLIWWLPAGILGSVIGLRLGPLLPARLFRWLALVLIAVSGALSVLTGVDSVR